MTKIYPFQRTARWISLAFLAMAILLGGWAMTWAQEEPAEEPKKVDPRVEQLKKKQVTHELETGRGQELPVVVPDAQAEPEDVNPHHSMLRRFVGHWQAQARMYLEPGGSPVESRGVARNELILNGNALRMDYKGEFQGQPFVGFGIDGYDMDKNEHFSTWMDSMSTGISYDTGVRCKHDGDVDLVTFNGQTRDPASGATVNTKTRLSMRTSTTYTIEQWIVPADGDETPSMQIIFTRQE